MDALESKKDNFNASFLLFHNYSTSITCLCILEKEWWKIGVVGDFLSSAFYRDHT